MSDKLTYDDFRARIENSADGGGGKTDDHGRYRPTRWRQALGGQTTWYWENNALPEAERIWCGFLTVSGQVFQIGNAIADASCLSH